jgi:hypothetical protein
MSGVRKNDRELLVVVNLVDFGIKKWEWLYHWLDTSAVPTTNILLGAHYKKITFLEKSKASCEEFLKKMSAICAKKHVKALDVILHLHGAKQKLWFADGSIKTDKLSDQIKALNLRDRLRLLYSVACYGSSHAQDFVDAGFRTASGAIGVNTNSDYNYPAVLSKWTSNGRYKDAVELGNNPLMVASHDAVAKKMGFRDANSKKVINGMKYLQITSPADATRRRRKG